MLRRRVRARERSPVLFLAQVGRARMVAGMNKYIRAAVDYALEARVAAGCGPSEIARLGKALLPSRRANANPYFRDNGLNGKGADAEQDGMISPEPQAAASAASTDLTEADNAFFLGAYRNAVSHYQLKIEKRTGVRLGKIGVRDYRQYDRDVLFDLERARYPWLVRWFKRSAIKAHLRQWRNYLQSTQQERALACMACYFRSAVYVSFSHDIRCHEEGIAFAAVHELSHVLWERLEGEPLDRPRAGTSADREKFRVLVEGYATYAEQVWFLDMYPKCVKEILPRHQPTPGGVHFQGMQRIRSLVEEFGEQVLLEIPKRWRTFRVDVR